MEKSGSQTSESPSQLMDARIKELGDWRRKMLEPPEGCGRDSFPGVHLERQAGSGD